MFPFEEPAKMKQVKKDESEIEMKVWNKNLDQDSEEPEEIKVDSK